MERSVFTPGAGHQPPVLAGRDQLVRDWRVALSETSSQGRPRARDTLLVGPRGVGKTALLSVYGAEAAERGYEVVNLQAVAGRSGLVEGLLQRAADRRANGAGAWQRARRAFDRVESVSVGAIGLSAAASRSARQARGDALDAGTLAQSLVALADEVRKDVEHGGVLITVDELQVASADDLVLLAAMRHRLKVELAEVPVLFAGTGLPHTLHAMTEAGVTHPDRLLVFDHLPVTLEHQDALFAIVEPSERVGVSWHPDAAELIVAVSSGYPAHLQLFAHNTWVSAEGPTTVTVDDARAGVTRTTGELEQRTLGPRWDRLTDRQSEYLAALALLGGRSGARQVAAALGRTTTELSWVRDQLLREGDIYAPRRGVVALTVPLFAPYLLSRYEQDLPYTDIPVLSLAQMRRNATSSLEPSLEPSQLAHLPEPADLAAQRVPAGDPGHLGEHRGQRHERAQVVPGESSGEQRAAEVDEHVGAAPPGEEGGS